jgi:DNA invertase Pin-like site-specific DNA recombinase
MSAVPPRARIEQWQEAQTEAARVRTESARPHAFPLPVDPRPNVPNPVRGGTSPDATGRRGSGAPTALRRPDDRRNGTRRAPRVAPIPGGMLVHGRSAESRARAFSGRVLAVAADDAPRDDAEPRSLYLVDDAGKSEPVWVRSTDIDWPPCPIGPGDPAIGYVTAASDDELTLDDCATIRAAAQRAGWQLLEIVRDRDRGRASLARPGLAYALDQIDAHRARALVVSNLRRLSRSIVDLAKVMRRLLDAGAVLIGLDLGFDTSTPEGHYAAMVLIEFGVWERERIAERTRMGLERTKARGGARGRPAVADHPELQQRIASLRAGKMTMQAIADVLNAEGVPTLRGGAMWRPSSVQAALGYRRPANHDGHAPANGPGGRRGR